VVRSVQRRLSPEGNLAGRLSQPLEGAGDEAPYNPDGAEHDDRDHEQPGYALGHGVTFPEEDPAPKAPGVGQRRRRGHHREADEEWAALERGGEEVLVREEADRQRERGERGRR
jgi:hypothetical protein